MYIHIYKFISIYLKMLLGIHFTSEHYLSKIIKLQIFVLKNLSQNFLFEIRN